MFGSKDTFAPLRAKTSTALNTSDLKPSFGMREQPMMWKKRGSRMTSVVRCARHYRRGVVPVVQESAASVLEVGDECHARGLVRYDQDHLRVHTVLPETVQDTSTEIVISDAADNCRRMAEPRDRVDEDSGCTAGKRAKKSPGLRERGPPARPHDFHEQFAHRPNVSHVHPPGSPSREEESWHDM